jgi:hypothetical protein
MPMPMHASGRTPGPAARLVRVVSSAVVVAVLRSPLRRLLDPRLVALSYTGRTSGRSFSIPVAYARDHDDLVVFVGDHDRKQWWRNFADPRSVRVLLRGREYDASAQVVRDRATREAYHHGDPKAVARVAREHQPLFVRIRRTA